MCVQVSAERNERLLTAAAFFLGRHARRDSFIEVSIGSYNNYLSRIRGAYSPLPLAPLAPLPASRCLLLELRDYRGGRERGETTDSCSIGRVLSRPR